MFLSRSRPAAVPGTWYHQSAHHQHGTRCVLHYLVRRGAEQPTPDSRMAAVADDQEVGADLQSIVRQRLPSMANADLRVGHQSGFVDLLRCSFLRLTKETLRRLLLTVDLIDRARIARQLLDGDEKQLGLRRARQRNGRLQCTPRPLRSVNSNHDSPVHLHPARRTRSGTETLGSDTVATEGATRGWKNVCAISVGTTALPITTVTKIVYCV